MNANIPPPLLRLSLAVLLCLFSACTVDFPTLPDPPQVTIV